ncbi:lipopolysaccharide biosynthesis protein [Noviherbaspirillum cavernae]|uniref:Lipopolysaccharide biosynthesis protein n=1 Tax=Noviherbaspirillum cavernae TaxID=2320862 RepID=A0A418X0C5_9BURK|nr:lipopolysaccharide biosynthesis protein [Noviherbaspirillum cavernae]RJG05775.1 lipopolysaccharide biosynthesis protein [Noviherbaspirillum cavernae]
MEKVINLSSKGISAVFWGGFGSILRALLQIGTQIILARILGPVEYGIFAIAATILSFSKFFSDIGISYGLIQKKTITDNDIKFVFTWQVILGIVVSLIVFFLAGPLSTFFNEPRLVPVIEVASVICFINAVCSPSLNLLKRELDFRSMQVAHIIGYIVGYIFIGIPMALNGNQVWALIAAFISSEAINFILLYRKARHPVGIVLRQHDDGGLMSYGIKVFGTNLVNWIIGNVDRVIIGRMFPTAQVGFYSLSYNLVSSPTITTIGVIQSALFSTSARVQDDFNRLRKALLTMIGAVTLLLFPVFFGIAAASETILHSLYGASWLGATELLRPIALAMPLYLLLGMATPLLWVAGRTKTEFFIQIPIAVAFTAAAVIGAHYSLEAVAWTVFGMYFIRAAAILGMTCRALEISLRRIMRTMSGGLITTFNTTVAILLTDFGTRELTAMPSLWLAADVAAGVIGIVASLWIFPTLVNRHVAQLFEKIALRLPSGTANRLQRFLYRGQMKRSM